MPCGATINLPLRTLSQEGIIDLTCPEGHKFRLPVDVLRASGRDAITCGHETRTDVLCGCGWGLLAVPESKIPDNCPLCGHDFQEA